MKSLDPSRCPLCAETNDCQLCTAVPHKGPCWCEKANIPKALLDQVPDDAKNKACLCHNCVEKFHRAKETPMKPVAGDFYLENGMIVFTEQYHRRRGYCCGSGCRHCPYPPDATKAPSRPTIQALFPSAI